MNSNSIKHMDEHTRSYLDAQKRYNDAIADMIISGLNKLEAFAREKIITNLEKASAEFKKAMAGDVKAIKTGEKYLNAAEQTAKRCIAIAESLVKLVQKFGKVSKK